MVLQPCWRNFKVTSLKVREPWCGQDVRTWETVWRGDAGYPVFGCCFLPSAPDVLAVCCPEDHIRIFDTSAAEPTHAVERAGVGSLWGAASKPRQLLCIAASADGSALAASGESKTVPWSRHLDLCSIFPHYKALIHVSGMILEICAHVWVDICMQDILSIFPHCKTPINVSGSIG